MTFAFIQSVYIHFLIYIMLIFDACLVLPRFKTYSTSFVVGMPFNVQTIDRLYASGSANLYFLLPIIDMT